MLLKSLMYYEEDEMPVSEFKVGDKVTNEYGEELTVSRVTFQMLTRVYMYQFEGQGFACSALGMRKVGDDHVYKIGEIVQLNRSADNILDEMLQSQGKLNGTRDFMGKDYALEFFQPDNTYVEWIRDYANGRVIIDVGTGSGRLTHYLQSAGARVIGIEPFFDMDKLSEYNRWAIMNERPMVQILGKKIEDCGSLIKGQGNKILILFARPCHSDFVTNTLNMKDSETEVLYITKPDVVANYLDLGGYDDQKVLIPHKGFSVESEVVYSVKNNTKVESKFNKTERQQIIEKAVKLSEEILKREGK